MGRNLQLRNKMNTSMDTTEVSDCHLRRSTNPFEADLDVKFRLTWQNLRVSATVPASENFVTRMVRRLAKEAETRGREEVDILKSVTGYADAGQMIAIMGPSGAGKTTLLDALAKRIVPTYGTIRVDGIELSAAEISKISSYVPQFDALPDTLTVSEYIAFSCALRLDERVTCEERHRLASDIIRNLTLRECEHSLIRTLAGGEKKRLSLAAEIVTKPRILFLDEPTTGLDTSAALRVVESIKTISTDGIVMCSVHQPSIMIYNLFSHVIFLSEGELAFSGSLADAQTFFERRRPRWIVQFKWLLWRLYHENRRTLLDGLIAFNYYAISVTLVAMFFWGIDTRKERGVQDVIGFLYLASAETVFSTAYTPLYEIERKIPIFMREATMYCPSAYYVATLVSWLPKTIFKSLILTIMLFAILGTRATFFPVFFQFFTCAVASALCGLAYGSMVASFIEDNEMATTVMVPIDLLALLMSGIYYNLWSLAWYTVGFKYFSIFYYTNEALAIAHWSRINYIECENNQNSNCISSGAEVLLRYGYEASNFWIDIFGMILLTSLLNCLGYLGMKRQRSLKSKY